ncbi:uncharacterized protein LOC135962307 [Calliphora vicina]|uniref:uncharacterized protein LOC135962307 n=1 Tax=Calliphora vicina TaxID=7373 RepID=UPI00325B9328
MFNKKIKNYLFNILTYSACLYFACNTIGKIKKPDNEPNQRRKDEYAIYMSLLNSVIIVCLIMILVPSLQITGIINRRHQLMLPWMILNAIGFDVNRSRFGFVIILVIVAVISLSTNVGILVSDLVLIAGILALIIYALHKDIRKEKSQMPGRVIRGSQIGYY